jgi:gas vesicle protein
MDKSLGQLLIGAVLGAVAIEVLREKKPKVFDEIKNNAKDITKNFKSVYDTIKTAANEWAQNPS